MVVDNFLESFHLKRLTFNVHRIQDAVGVAQEEIVWAEGYRPLFIACFFIKTQKDPCPGKEGEFTAFCVEISNANELIQWTE